MPDECRSIDETLRIGESLLSQDEPENAEIYFQLAWTKGKILEEHLATEKMRLMNIARMKAESEEREKNRQLTLQDEHLRSAREQALLAALQEEKRPEKSKNREKPLPTSHTVLRGETLPMIAAQSDIYGDQTLWPLIYRANRDQISDPGHIRPGQTLRIPRNLSREEVTEAHRFSQERPLR